MISGVRKYAALLVATLLASLFSAVSAHEIRPAIATVTFSDDGRYMVEIGSNLEAVLAGIGPVHSDTDESPNARTYNVLRALPPDEFRARLKSHEPIYLAGIAIEFDGLRVSPGVTATEVPAVGDTRLIAAASA